MLQHKVLSSSLNIFHVVCPKISLLSFRLYLVAVPESCGLHNVESYIRTQGHSFGILKESQWTNNRQVVTSRTLRPELNTVMHRFTRALILPVSVVHLPAESVWRSYSNYFCILRENVKTQRNGKLKVEHNDLLIKRIKWKSSYVSKAQNISFSGTMKQINILVLK